MRQDAKGGPLGDCRWHLSLGKDELVCLCNAERAEREQATAAIYRDFACSPPGEMKGFGLEKKKRKEKKEVWP